MLTIHPKIKKKGINMYLKYTTQNPPQKFRFILKTYLSSTWTIKSIKQMCYMKVEFVNFFVRSVMQYTLEKQEEYSSKASRNIKESTPK